MISEEAKCSLKKKDTVLQTIKNLKYYDDSKE